MKKDITFTLPDISYEMANEEDPTERIKDVKWSLMNKLFNQFEDEERKSFHDASAEKLVIDILGNIAKAKIEKKNQTSLGQTFHPSETKIDLYGEKLKEWKPIEITKENLDRLILRKSDSKYYHGFATEETILEHRKLGLLHMTISKLLKKRRKGLTIAIDRKMVGGGHCSGWVPTLMVSW